MHVMERILLYSMALIVGLRLLMPDSGESVGSEIAPPPTDVGLAALRNSRPPRVEDETSSRKSLSLTDSAGKTRILLSVADDGTPSIMLRSPSGKVAMRLAVEADDTSVIELGEGADRTSLVQHADGPARLEMRSAGGTVTVGVDDNGTTSLSLNRKDGRLHAKLTLTDRQGAQLHIGPEGEGGGVTAGWNPGGDAYLSVLQADGKTGPVIQAFKDGLAQVAINPAVGEAGPSMLMTPDGVSVMSVRLPNGQPGASLLSSQDGHSVIAVASPDGRKRAEMRAHAGEAPTIRLIDPDMPSDPDTAPEQKSSKPDVKKSRKPGPRVDLGPYRDARPVSHRETVTTSALP